MNENSVDQALAKNRLCAPRLPRRPVWELSTFMTEWLRVYGDQLNRELSGALWFYERWLPDRRAGAPWEADHGRRGGLPGLPGGAGGLTSHRSPASFP
jgi:hypothetical protein